MSRSNRVFSSLTAPRNGFLAISTQLIHRPRLVCLLCALVILMIGTGLRWVEKDPSVDAFVAEDHPAAVARNAARELFALEDPLVVGLVATDGKSLFRPDALNALRQIEGHIKALPGVDANGLTSVLSESAIAGAADGSGELLVTRIVPDGPITSRVADDAKIHFASMPMMSGLLGSENGSTLTLIVPVDDPNDSVSIYHAVLDITKTGLPAGVTAHVAGVAAMNAGLAWMVDTDTRVFIPSAVLMVLVILLLALRSWRAVIGPLLVIAGAATMAVGSLGWMGGRYYLISTALPVVVMAMAVADSLHFTTFYLRCRRLDPFGERTLAITTALRHTGLPIALTSLTTTAGFMGLVLGSGMQPIREFGLFAAVGVVGAWLLSVTLLPAIILLLKVEPANKLTGAASSLSTGVVQRLTSVAFAHPGSALTLVAGALLVMAWGSEKAQFDYQRQHYFQSDNPVRIADVELNARLAGLNFLDVVVAAPEENGLMKVSAMNAMAQLQKQLSRIEGVEQVTSIVDYMTVMHAALTSGSAGLPQRKNAPAQYMFLYEASGSPDDYEEEIDYTYQHALMRAQLRTDSYQQTRHSVASFRAIIREFNAEQSLSAEVSGRVAVNEGWMTLLVTNHFVGLGIAMGLVFVCCLLMFKGSVLAVLAMLPVVTGVLFVYALMGFLNIDLAPATAMTSAIATGLGTDFGVHLIAHIQRERSAGTTVADALNQRYLLIGTACFYSAMALTAALLVVCLSSAPPLRWFGGLVAAGTMGSLFGALVLIPACLGLLERRQATREFTQIKEAC